MRLRGVRSAWLGAVLAVSGCVSARDGLVEPACIEPVISGAAVAKNATNVLSVFVTAKVRGADSVMVRFGVYGSLDSLTPANPPGTDSTVALVLGLSPSTLYAAEVIAFNRCSATTSDPLFFTTEALPSDLPRYTAGGSSPASGYVVFGSGNYGLVIDNTGRVVWYHRFPNGPGLNFQVQPDGRYSARPTPSAGMIATWVEVGPGGDSERTLGCANALQPRMHDMIAQPDGSYWLLCDHVRRMDLSAQGESAQADVLGTDVQHRAANGELLFDWSPFDHLDVDLSVLDPVDRAGPIINWTHGNAIDLDADGNLLVSFRNLSEVTKINTQTGSVMWRMGGARNQFKFLNSSVPPFVHQHGVRASGVGQLLMLDNLGDPVASRAERYEVDGANLTARLSGSFGASAGLIAQVGGNAQSLPSGHTMVAFGSGGGVEEYDASGKVVWRVDGDAGYVFRAQRIRSLYRPGVGDPR